METDSARFLHQIVTVTVERPLGSRHPDWGFVYPVNYGYLAGTISGDGEALDAYVLGVAAPCATFRGRCIAIIHRLDDDDDKLVVVPDGEALTDADIRTATDFQERYFRSEIWR